MLINKGLNYLRVRTRFLVFFYHLLLRILFMIEFLFCDFFKDSIESEMLILFNFTQGGYFFTGNRTGIIAKTVAHIG
jgi:hypothetical protein